MPDHAFQPKPLNAIFAPRPLATQKAMEWRGRPGEIKPLWAIIGHEPPYDWQPSIAVQKMDKVSGSEEDKTAEGLSNEWWNLRDNIERARQIADQEKAKRQRAHNDLGDAMRHAEWMRRTTHETNPFTAWLVGTGHELDNLLDGQPLRETLMDLHNNRVGRDAGRHNLPVDGRRLRTLPLHSAELNPYSD